MLIHLKNMQQPESTNDYQTQNLILNALTQYKSNIASNSGNALFGDNGVLVNQDFDIDDSGDFYCVAANHGNDFTSPDNISLIKTADLEYEWDNARYGWHNERNRFVSQKCLTPSIVDSTSLRLKDKFLNKAKNHYHFSITKEFPNGNYFYMYNQDYIVMNFDAIVDGKILKTDRIKKGVYKWNFYMNNNATAWLLTRQTQITAYTYLCQFGAQWYLRGAIEHHLYSGNQYLYGVNENTGFRFNIAQGMIDEMQIIGSGKGVIDDNAQVILDALSYSTPLLNLDSGAATYNFGIYLEEI